LSVPSEQLPPEHHRVAEQGDHFELG